MDLLIRTATPADAAGVVAILNPIIETGRYTTFVAPFTVAEERAFIENLPEQAIFHLAEKTTDKRLVGFQTLAPFSSYTPAFDHVGVMGTFVALSQRRQGIATRLFAATFAEARHQGYEKIFTYIRADNLAALATYMAHGFRVIGTAQKQAKINGRYVDEFLVECFL